MKRHVIAQGVSGGECVGGEGSLCLPQTQGRAPPLPLLPSGVHMRAQEEPCSGSRRRAPNPTWGAVQGGPSEARGRPESRAAGSLLRHHRKHTPFPCHQCISSSAASGVASAGLCCGNSFNFYKKGGWGGGERQLAQSFEELSSSNAGG